MLMPLPDSLPPSSRSAFLLAADVELEVDFAADAEEDERLPLRAASLTLEKVISSAAIRVWIPGVAFMMLRRVNCGPRE
ncbi:MAG: hypothetical protein FD157_2323 [Rhodocyclaceae bacterium]|nr:MAG: hypothetical protein FD157_2323 [Rhodocyclaceae bacterium]TND04118.1 MAG: hypothetical protein FD118_976 [Rhodocyclaceae bacterium]